MEEQTSLPAIGNDRSPFDLCAKMEEKRFSRSANLQWITVGRCLPPLKRRSRLSFRVLDRSLGLSLFLAVCVSGSGSGILAVQSRCDFPSYSRKASGLSDRLREALKIIEGTAVGFLVDRVHGLCGDEIVWLFGALVTLFVA